MDLVEFRDYCLSLGDVEEKTPFGKFARRFDSILVFYVEGHMFCLLDINNFVSVNVRSAPDEVERLKMTYEAISKPSNLSERYWVQVSFGEDIPDKEIYELVEKSFHIVKAKYAKKNGRRKV